MNDKALLYLRKQIEEDLSSSIKEKKELQKKEYPYTTISIYATKLDIGLLKAICLVTEKSLGDAFQEAIRMLKDEYELTLNREIAPVDCKTKLPSKLYRKSAGHKHGPARRMKKLLKDLDALIDMRREENASKFDIT